MSFLTVIIPVYNGENFIRDSVYSVLNQDCLDIQIMIVDDGSTDCTQKICEEITKQDRRVFYVRKQNGGVASARNFGIKKILEMEQKNQPEYLTFLDSDDIWDDQIFDENIKMRIIDGKADIYVFSYAESDMLLKHKKVIKVDNKILINNKESERSKMVMATENHNSSILYKFKLIKQYDMKFFECYRHDDVTFRHRMLYISNKVEFIDEVIFYYRNNPYSITHDLQNVDYIYSEVIEADKRQLQWYIKNFSKDKNIIQCCYDGIAYSVYEYLLQMCRCDYSKNFKQIMERIRKIEFYDLILDETRKLWLPHIEFYKENPRLFYIFNRIYGRIFMLCRRIKRSVL